jgi:hypothetical protein
VRPSTLPRGKAIGNITEPEAISRRPVPDTSVSPMAECPRPSTWPISCCATACRSNPAAEPLSATDHGWSALNCTSASTMLPLITSMV